jgi:hypothetical protein
MYIDDIICFLNFLQSKGTIEIKNLNNLEDFCDEFDNLTGEI